MAYPTNYQDAEHRRALNAILDDMHTMAAGDESDAAPTAPEDVPEASGSRPQARTAPAIEAHHGVPDRAAAASQVHITRIPATQFAGHTTN